MIHQKSKSFHFVQRLASLLFALWVCQLKTIDLFWNFESENFHRTVKDDRKWTVIDGGQSMLTAELIIITDRSVATGLRPFQVKFNYFPS